MPNWHFKFRSRRAQASAALRFQRTRVLLMSKCDGLSNEDIARALGVTSDSVARYLGRAVAFARRVRWD